MIIYDFVLEGSHGETEGWESVHNIVEETSAGLGFQVVISV